MSLYCSVGSVDTDLSAAQLKELLVESLAKLGARKNVLAVPPDQSREHSRAGDLARYAWEHYGDKLKAVLPAIGTHTPMRPDQIAHMFGNMPQELFKVHNWRTDVETLGELPEFAAATPSVAPNVFTPPTAGTAGAEQVNGPAMGLIVVAILGALAQAAGLIMHLAGAATHASSQMPNAAWVNMFSGTIGVVSGVIGLLMSAVVLLGALKMKKLESYGFAMAASIIAMVPCVSPCCLLGLPIGIWALVVLMKPEVKSAFH